MKLTADQYYYVYFCMLEEPAMFKPLLYSLEFVSINQSLRPGQTRMRVDESCNSR